MSPLTTSSSPHLPITIVTDLIDLVSTQFRLPINSIHGLSHWLRVEAIGLFLAEETEADKTVVQFFAYLHDSQRENEDEDIHHGARAKEYIDNLVSHKRLPLSPTQIQQLTQACTIHTICRTQPDDVTVATCIDADRLDLWRLGIQPSPSRLFTQAGRRFSTNKQLYQTFSQRNNQDYLLK